MTDSTPYALTHLALLTVSGADAAKFLQGQCSQDINTLSPTRAVAGSFNNAKGRSVANVYLFAETKETIHLICEASVAPLLYTHLKKYILFFRGTELVQSEQFSALGVRLAPEQLAELTTPGHRAVQFDDERTMLWVNLAEQPLDNLIEQIDQHQLITSSDWKKSDILKKVFWIDAENSEAWIPQNYNLDLDDGISFSKGCYTGQEVIARLHYKGESKKRLYAFKTVGASQTNIFSANKVVGSVVQHTETDDGTYGLMILKTSAAEETLYSDETQQWPVELLN